MTVQEKMESLITAANTATGESAADLTAAVQDLVDGYGGGGETLYMTSGGNLYKANMEYAEVTVVQNYGYYQAANLISVHFPNLTSAGLWSFSECPMLKSMRFEKFTNVGNAVGRSSHALETIELGSIGHPVTGISGMAFWDDNQQGLTITVYVNASTLAEAQATQNVGTIAPWGATNATIVYKSSTTGEVLV